MKDQELQGILIVDDDEAVEEVTTRMIRRMGLLVRRGFKR